MKRVNVVELTSPGKLVNQDVQEYWHNDQLYTGLVYELFQNRVEIEYEVINGLKNGKEVEYSDDMKVRATSNYKDGLLDGLSIRYFDNGSIQEQSVFEKGVCIESTLFDEQGVILSNEKIMPEDPSYDWLMYLRRTKDL